MLDDYSSLRQTLLIVVHICEVAGIDSNHKLCPIFVRMASCHSNTGNNDRCDDCFRRIQAILWSCIGGTIVVVALLCIYVRCDNYECQGPILYKYVLCWLYISHRFVISTNYRE